MPATLFNVVREREREIIFFRIFIEKSRLKESFFTNQYVTITDPDLLGRSIRMAFFTEAVIPQNNNYNMIGAVGWNLLYISFTLNSYVKVNASSNWFWMQ